LDWNKASEAAAAGGCDLIRSRSAAAAAEKRFAHIHDDDDTPTDRTDAPTDDPQVSQVKFVLIWQ
jgi:hypothetical protein